jgi:hypothetical protein
MIKDVLKGIAKSILVCGLGVLVYSCTGEDGTNGVDGTQGIQGTQGSQGTQGILGMQGIQGMQGMQGIQGTQGIPGQTGATGATPVGFEFAGNYGSITETYSGTFTDGTPFYNMTEFKNTYYKESSSVRKSVGDAGNVKLQFYMERYVDVFYDISTSMSFTVSNYGTAEQVFTIERTGRYVNIIDEEGKLFYYREYMYPEFTAWQNVVISNFSYDETTKKLMFSYSYYNANTKVTTSGVVDIVVVEYSNKVLG